MTPRAVTVRPGQEIPNSRSANCAAVASRATYEQARETLADLHFVAFASLMLYQLIHLPFSP